MTETSRVGDAIQTARPRFRRRAAIVFVAIILVLVVASFLKQGPPRFYYAALAGLATVALTVQYRREHVLAANRLVAVAVVTEKRKPLETRVKWLNVVLSRLSGNIPLVKYSFVAFDQKTYQGQTGWGANTLHKGARIAVLYNPQNPARNHPLGSFIFYSFEQS
jgi:hypothetical protein